MAENEQQTERKKRRLCRRIFKWIGLGLLSLLIIAATFLHAPWKVITLLLIILAACTALPKPARKWFWLSVGAVVITLIVWVFLPEDDEGWRPYTFDEELAALEAKYAVPDEENAAMIYNQLLEDYKEAAFEPNFLDPNLGYLTRIEPWSSKDYPKLAEWIKGHENTIAKLIEASKFEKCRFPIVADYTFYSQFPGTLAPLRHWTYLLRRAINNDIAEGRIEQAIEKNFAILQMAKHQYQQPTKNDMLVGTAIELAAINQFNRFVVTGNATEGHLRMIEKAVADIEYEWSYYLPRIIEYEKLMTKNTFCSSGYEINQEGKVRFSRDPTAVAREHFSEEIPPPPFWQRKLWKAGIICACLGMPSAPDKVSKNMDSGFQSLYAMAEPDFDWGGSPKEFSFNPMKVKLNWIYLTRIIADLQASMLEHLFYTLHDSYLQNIAKQRGARIIITSRRYKNKTGHWPENLDEIKSFAPAEIFVDPLNNDSFIYRVTADDFTLYSKGKNNIDEGGKYESKWDPNTYEHTIEKDDRLIWP